MHLSTTIPCRASRKFRLSRPEESVRESKRIDDDILSDASDRFGQGAGEDSYSGVRPLRIRFSDLVRVVNLVGITSGHSPKAFIDQKKSISPRKRLPIGVWL
jgi:hypothetical protein